MFGKSRAIETTVLILALLLFTLLLLLLSTEPAEAAGWTTQRLTNDTKYDLDAAVSGTRVAWQADGGSDGGTDYEIFTWTPTGGVVQVTANDYDDTSVQVSGQRLAWTAHTSDWEVCTWTPSGGTVQITPDGVPGASHLGLSGDRIIYVMWNGASDVLYTWTPAGGAVDIYSSNPQSPSVSGDYIVWVASDGHDLELWRWEPVGGLDRVSVDDYDQNWPTVSGINVAWCYWDGADYEVFSGTMGTGVHNIVQVTDNAVDDTYPIASGGRIVWFVNDGDTELYTWKRGGSVVRLTDNTVSEMDYTASGDRVVWYAPVAPGTDNEILTWTSATGTVQMTDNDWHDEGCGVSGEAIVWHANQGTGGEIFLASPTAPNPVYRFYNFTNNTHFFTPTEEEKNLVLATWPHIFRLDGVAYSTNPFNNTQPLYRFYNRVSRSHFYTADLGEKATIEATLGHIFTLDGQTYAVNPVPVPNSIPVYRFYNVRNGSHFYTADESERASVQSTLQSVYLYEGPAYWLGQ